jgi:hypothetical protein
MGRANRPHLLIVPQYGMMGFAKTLYSSYRSIEMIQINELIA